MNGRYRTGIVERQGCWCWNWNIRKNRWERTMRSFGGLGPLWIPSEISHFQSRVPTGLSRPTVDLLLHQIKSFLAFFQFLVIKRGTGDWIFSHNRDAFFYYLLQHINSLALSLRFSLLSQDLPPNPHLLPLADVKSKAMQRRCLKVSLTVVHKPEFHR